MPKSDRHLLVLILSAALAVRLAAGVFVARQTERRYGPEARFLFPDSREYHALAVNLVERGRFEDDRHRRAWRMPAYSIALAGLYATGARSPAAARILTNLLDVLNVVLVFLLACRMFGRRAGLLAAGMAAAYPFFVYFSNLVLSDTAAVTGVLLLSFTFARLTGCRPGGGAAPPPLREAMGLAALAGLAWALATLIQAALAPLGLLFGGFLFLRFQGKRPEAIRPGPCPYRNGVSRSMMI